MTLSEISIRNPVFAWMLMAALILFGGIGFSRMGVSEMPDVDFPVITIHLSLEGAAPEVMETDVVDIVEDAVTSIQGIREITSSCRQGIATVSVEFELGRNIDAALQEVQTKIAQVQRRLPNEIDPPTVTKTNPEDNPIIWLALSGERPIRELMEYTRNSLKDQFQTVSGVGEVFLGGFLEPNLRVWLDAGKLAEKELTVDDVLAAIEREHVEMPAGRIETTDKEYNIRTLGEAPTAEEFSRLVISQRGGQPVYKTILLKEVAAVEEGLNDVRRVSRVNGQTAIGLGVRKQRGANAVEVAENVTKKVKEIQSQLPQGLHLDINFNSTRFIKESIGELKFTLLLSALLTALVCWLFLGSFSSTFNILLAIPTSVIGTFLVLYFAGFTLNNFTLLGLVLAIGIVVDDAIMVLENIYRHQEERKGGSPKGIPSKENKIAAAITGSRQITFAAIAATLAIIAIFLPVAFMKGVIGKFFFQFGVTLSVAVSLSLLEALTLTPMRCSQFVSTGRRTTRLGKEVDRFIEKLAPLYRRLLGKTLQHRGKVVIASALFFVLSLGSLKFLKKEFVPAQDQSMFLVSLQTPVGSSLSFTDSRFRQAEAFLTSRPEVKRYYAAVGGFGGSEVNSGVIFITLKPKGERKLSQQKFMDLVRKELNNIPDTKAFIQDLSMRGMTAKRGFPVEFNIQGPDWEKLVDLSQKIEEKMKANTLFVDVDTDYQTDMPEVRIIPDREKAAARGVSVRNIARTINVAFGGVQAGKFIENGRRNDVRVRLKEEDRVRSGDIQSLFVRNNHGELIPLSEVTTLSEKPTLLKITRTNRERSVGLMANVAKGGSPKGASQAEALKAASRIASEILPEGYRVVFSGSAQTFKESFTSLTFALWLGILVAYMILASQFNSFLHPFTVLLALPFSVSGAFIALLVGWQSLNIYSMIGLILLMGIAKKNSILLVDFTNQMRRQGKPLQEALMTACPVRLRPILMTSVSTIAAAIPPALALGPGSETRIPMAIAVIGGVLVSTGLTLFVVPATYSLLARFERTKT
ncbi:MAG: efflux RND transporter permease subunit [Deltaproteobacteria bacterium]|nr:efflux RND transporter permease subunit [Deltaproteobacteria bacterium]